MSSIQGVEWGECLLENLPDPAMEREARRTLGVPFPVIRYFTPCPWLADSVAHSNSRIGKLVHLDPNLADLIFLAVSQDNSCRYCYASQRAQMRILGYDEARIRDLEQASFQARGNPRERLMLDFVLRFSRANPAPGAADLAALGAAGFSDGEIDEILYSASNTVAANRITTLPALPVDAIEAMDFRGIRGLLRPILARLLRSRHRPGVLEPFSEELVSGPFGYVAREFDGLPLVAYSRRTFLAAWDSPILTKRTKALICAVIARGLASERAEAEAKRLLAAEGLDEARVDEILAHLGAPELDAVEALVVPFARETIRYRPDEIQPRARELRRWLSAEQFLEVVGMAALANGAIRISLVRCEGR
jgi:AhpD family alkylhydroperoxidase